MDRVIPIEPLFADNGLAMLMFLFGGVTALHMLMLFVSASKERLTHSSETGAIGFFDDYYFIVWNTFCVIVTIFFGYFLGLDPAETLVSSFGVENISLEPAKNIFHAVLLIDHLNIEYLGYALIAILAIRTQLKNLDRPKQYWWAWDVSKKIWIVRFVVVIINVVIVAIISWKLVVFSISSFVLIVGEGFSVNLLAAEGHAGLSEIGHLIWVSVSILFLRSIVGIFGLIDHTRFNKPDPVYLAGDLYNMAYGLYALVGFWWFAGEAQKAIFNSKSLALADIDAACGITATSIPSDIQCDVSTLFMREIVTSVGEFPFPSSDFVLGALLAFLPIVAALLARFAKAARLSKS